MLNMIGFKLNVAVKWVALWICICENLGSDVNLEIIYLDRFLSFSYIILRKYQYGALK